LSSPPLIVIVEDDASLQHALVGLMRSLGYRARGYASAEQFLASADCALADCVTTDIQMGAMNGFELTRQLAFLRPQLPVIIITARAEPDAQRHADDCGALCLLRKPFDGNVLADWIARALAPRPP